MCRAAVPFLAKVRRCLAVSPSSQVPSDASQVSAMHFAQAVNTLVAATGPFDITKLALFSYNDLFRHSLNIEGDDSDLLVRLGCTLSQFRALVAVLDSSDSQRYVNALSSEKVTSWLANLAWTILYVSETLSSPQSEPEFSLQTVERFREVFAVCTRIIKVTSERGMVESSIEMLDARLVFSVETFCSYNAATEKDSGALIVLVLKRVAFSDVFHCLLSDMIESWIFRWIGALDMVEDQAVRQRGTQQIRTVFSRVVARQGMADWVVAMWKKLHIETSSPPITDVCGAIGCGSLELPPLQCGRCGSQSYCNQTCQKK